MKYISKKKEGEKKAKGRGKKGEREGEPFQHIALPVPCDILRPAPTVRSVRETAATYTHPLRPYLVRGNAKAHVEAPALLAQGPATIRLRG
jgi:hypothetical protein